MTKQASTGWLRRLQEEGDVSLNGFRVEALDGTAGKIDQVIYWNDAKTPDYVVVDSRRWLFGRKSFLSIDVIEEVDLTNRRLRVRLSREQVRQAPESLPGT